jgi:signal transduction histidine kinase
LITDPQDALTRLAKARTAQERDAAIAAIREEVLDLQMLAAVNERRRRQAESLERVVRILRDTQYVDEVLLVFVVTVSHELPVDCAAYAVEGDILERRAVRVRDTSGFTPELAVATELVEPFLALDEPTDAEALPPAARLTLFGGADGILVPLRIDSRLWGCFVVRASELPIDWPADERVTFFRTLGSHLEITLTNAHAYERELRRAQEREMLAEAARTILTHTALSPLADVMCKFAAALVHAQRACVLAWSGDRYEEVGHFGPGIEKTLAASSFDLHTRARRPPALVNDERRVQRLIDGPGYVVIPLARPASDASESIDAFLVVGNDRPARFARDDLRLLQELGALLVLALRNIELYEAMQRANRALQESNAFKDDLLAMLAHDFKSPLTVILGYCELLMEAQPAPAEVETIFAQTKRLVRLSDDALVLAQTQSEGFSLARSQVELGAFMGQCVNGSGAGSTRVMLDMPSEPILVELDPNRFRHVMDNLIGNALKYSEGQVTIRIHRNGETAEVDVEDRGIGIPQEELPNLFRRFGRAKNARLRGIAGSGVGLYVAKKIVDAHRGSLAVRSIENEGSTFTVTLPICHS